MKVARSTRNFPYGVKDRKFGPCRSPTARRIPLPIIPHWGAFVNRQFTQKKLPLIGQFFSYLKILLINSVKRFAFIYRGTTFHFQHQAKPIITLTRFVSVAEIGTGTVPNRALIKFTHFLLPPHKVRAS